MKAYFASQIISPIEVYKDCFLLVDNGQIKGISPKIKQGVPVISYQGYSIVPGYIDIHTHGALGYEPGYGNLEELSSWCQFKLQHGVTGFLAGTSTIPLAKVARSLKDVSKIMGDCPSNLIGVLMEGPFFTLNKHIGAQNPDYLCEGFSSDFRELIMDNRDIIKYLALDPEHQNACEILEFCNSLDIVAAAAHSSILYDEFKESKFKGFSAVIHTFNGMVGLHHRHPGLAYAACMEAELFAEIICDGFHVSYPVLELFFKLRGYEQAVLITDSMLATGLPGGQSYQIGDVKVAVDNAGKVSKSDGGLAGSTLTMDQAVANIVKILKIPLDKAIRMATLNPANLLGLKNKGILSLGSDADFLIIDDQLQVEATYLKGELVYSNLENETE